MFQFSKLYHGAKRSDHPPHIFATADAAYQGMVSFCKDQVLIHLYDCHGLLNDKSSFNITYNQKTLGKSLRLICFVWF